MEWGGRAKAKISSPRPLRNGKVISSQGKKFLKKKNRRKKVLSSEFAPFQISSSALPHCACAAHSPSSRGAPQALLWTAGGGKRAKAARVLAHLVGRLVSPFQLPGALLRFCCPHPPDLTFQNALLPQTGDEERVPGKGVEDRGREEV